MPFQTTIKQLAEKQGVEYAEAQGLVRYLECKGIAKKVGVLKNPAGKGKGSDIWELPETINVVLAGTTEVISVPVIPPAPAQGPTLTTLMTETNESLAK